MKGAKAFPYWKVVQHFSTGERADFWRNFFALFGVGRYSRRDLKEESQSLEAQYRQEGWVSARVRIERRIAKQRGQIIHFFTSMRDLDYWLNSKVTPD